MIVFDIEASQVENFERWKKEHDEQVRADEREKVLDDFKEKLIETMPIDICDAYEAMEHIEKVYAQLKEKKNE